MNSTRTLIAKLCGCNSVIKDYFEFGLITAMFVTVRGIDRLGIDFVLPTCPKFYNIFHPYDPIAYRFETLIDGDMAAVPPVVIPHHKGRKRMHLGIYSI